MLLTKKFEFDAAHRLNEDLGVKENRLHGHRYVLEITVKGPVKDGIIMSVADIKRHVQKDILDKLDHTMLNDIIDNPTLENVAIWIWKELRDRLPLLYEIKLSETPNNFVTYRGD